MLKIENLTVKYGLAVALDKISMEVKEGTIVAVLGNNGAGKTTLLKAISGIEPALKDSRIQLDGKDVTNKKPHSIVTEGISHVPEGRQVFSKLSVKQNLMLGAYLRKDKQGINDDLEFCYEIFPKLKQREHQTSGTLSGGEQQMLAIARALMSKPRFLMLDEPSMGLAPVIVEKIYENILNIKKKGLTLMIVEQNANIALNVCDYAYAITNGVVKKEGTPQELLNDASFINAFFGK